MITVGAYAKINLYLDIEAKRTDGYHDILSVMQTVSLCDEIKIERTECGIEVKNEINIEKERDLAYRAAAAFFAAAGVRGGARIEVQKHIPMGAGLAGGSADAAAVLRGLNEIYLNPLSEDKLLGIALTLGSDVPFCTVGGTKAIRGRGEKMANMPKMPDCAMVIAIGDDQVSTPKQFSELDREFNDFVEYKPQSDRIAAISAAFSAGNADIGDELYNIFEITGRYSPEIKSIMQKSGACGTLMSGSGSSVFGIFKTDGDAETAANELKRLGYRAFLCRPVEI